MLKSKFSKMLAICAALALTGCAFMQMFNVYEEPTPENLAKSAIAQIVYSSMNKKPDKTREFWENVMRVAGDIKTTSGKTPRTISNEIKSHINAPQYYLLIDSFVKNMFKKLNVEWDTEIPEGKVHEYMAMIQEAVQVGIDRWEETLLSGMPSEMPNNPYQS